MGKHNFFSYTAGCIAGRRRAGQHNTADLYRTVSNHLFRFVGGRVLYLHELNAAFIERFVTYLRSMGLKANTVQTYFSNLRSLCNQARKAGLLFYRKGISPFADCPLRHEKGFSRALPVAQVHRVATVVTKHPELEQAADFGTFCFLACGMPFVDLAHLKRQNIEGNDLVYKRHKTGTPIRIGITPGMWKLIHKYAGQTGEYLFPILPAGRPMSHEGYKARLRQHNAKLRLLGEKLHLPIRLTSYVFRHSWATEAQRKQTPIAMISQALGHTSERTTRFYLSTLEQPEMNRMNERIVGELDRLIVSCGFT